MVEAPRPKWVRQSTSVSVDLRADLTPLFQAIPNLDMTLFSDALSLSGVSHWFPVQSHVIPELLRPPLWTRPRDICVAAPTGSGKTLCYVLPIIQNLAPRITQDIKALIVLPIQDLALQVSQLILIIF